ncbi:hypothetical protein [Leptospira idonii]|uniref:Uncharacterized protein n=1 Tax=Leptospira idonii TaxID=1193500 RepID=A0A4R9LXH0_9LEPT|nr:hypothetical protein [Leptospira idonii]TGN18960.1 hypothetical protein EHS15_11125 [Leptospira idonii]
MNLKRRYFILGTVSLFAAGILFFPHSLSPQNKLLSLSDESKVLLLPEMKTDEIFLCQSEKGKVFGKNKPNMKECYSLQTYVLADSIGLFLQSEKNEEVQFAFYGSSGKQVFPEWEEPGYGKLTLLSFVATMKQQLLVQAIRKDKAYFYLRTKPGSWALEE